MAYDSKGKLSGIPQKEISIKWLKKQPKNKRDHIINTSSNVLWVMDVEPSGKVGRYDTPERKKDSGVKNLSKLRISHKPMQGPLFPHEPKVDDVVQQNIGDCWWLASICSMVNHPKGKEMVQEILKDVGEGWVVVRLFEPQSIMVERFIKLKKNIITHTPLVKFNKDIRTLHSRGANWVVMLEKALTAFNYDKHEFRPDDASYSKIIGGNSHVGMQLLTGQPAISEDVESKDSNEFNKLETFLSIPDLLYAMKDQLDMFLDAPSNVIGPDRQPITIRAVCSEMLEYCGNLSHLRGNTQRYNQQFMALLNDYITQAHDAQLAEKLNKVYLHKGKHKITVKGKPIEVCGEFRLEDFCDFMENKKSVWPSGENCDISAMDMQLRVALIGWATDKQLLPAKRGTARYSSEQIKLFNDVTTCLADKKLVCLGTRKYTGRVVDATGHSGGEKLSKGLAGGHAYAILDTLTQNRKKFFLVCNPWNSIGRGYLAEVFDDARVTIKPTAYGQKQIEQGNKLFEIESGVFWLELSDVTKRVSNLYKTV